MSRPSAKPALWKRLLRGLTVSVVLLVAAVVGRFLWVTRDRQPGYSVELHHPHPASAGAAGSLKVGFGRRDLNPDLKNPAEPVWMAGFSQGRSATNIHDNLEAVGVVIDNGQHRIALVSIDAIGFFHDDVVAVRKRLSAELKVDYTVVCSTHNHSTPDLLGLWGPDPFHSGVNPRYREQVIAACVGVVEDAVKALQPARMAAHELTVSPAGLVADTRKPEVYDPDVRVLHFVEAAQGKTLGTLVGWANHPETPWSNNRDITADFPGIIRESLEKGIRYGGTLHKPGLGGTHVYVNGAVGGLMTTHPSVTVNDPFLKTDFKEPSHDKTRAVGNQIASRILDRIASAKDAGVAALPIGIEVRTLDLPLRNAGFMAASLLGLLERGHSRWLHFRTEVGILRLGEVSMACIPGEVYPEIVNGGIVRAPGGDYDIEPLEVPPLRELMPGRVKFVLGLANDEIGYIIPKSEWDTEPPHLFGAPGAPYGEVNSVGPDTAWILHQALRRQCEALK
jgi:hypothetical protein